MNKAYSCAYCRRKLTPITTTTNTNGNLGRRLDATKSWVPQTRTLSSFHNKVTSSTEIPQLSASSLVTLGGRTSGA
ncbi:hypothetical protein L208DRAFT_475883 [Tricholoma matsutake]|nr:hypothetical protein L208DRAFT_475883 [Tricholoma matsutake 945]